MKEAKPLGIEPKNSDVAEKLDSSCNKRWKGYSYVEEYMEIIFISEFRVKYGLINEYLDIIY